MRLQHDEKESKMGPGELSELEAVVTFLEGADEEYEP